MISLLPLQSFMHVTNMHHQVIAVLEASDDVERTYYDTI